MTTIYEETRKIRRVSKTHPRSLILTIPPTVRDIMKFEHGTSISIEVCLDENEETYLRIQKID